MECRNCECPIQRRAPRLPPAVQRRGSTVPIDSSRCSRSPVTGSLATDRSAAKTLDYPAMLTSSWKQAHRLVKLALVSDLRDDQQLLKHEFPGGRILQDDIVLTRDERHGLDERS